MSNKIKVLVVDDQNMARGYFELYVKSSTNYELVKSLPTADAAVTFCDRHEVDLIVMDIMMRYGIDGLTAAEQIKKRHPKIKIILATSTSESSWGTEPELPVWRASGTRNTLKHRFWKLWIGRWRAKVFIPAIRPNRILAL